MADAQTEGTLTIPSALNALDDDVFADDAGYPSSCALGRELIHNDRALHANLRRVHVNQGFDHSTVGETNNAPDIAAYNGVIFGPYACVPTPWVRKAEWYFRLKIDASGGSDAIKIIPWIEPTHPYAGRASLADLQTTYAGTGASTNEGPVDINIADDTIQWVGFTILSELVSGSPSTGGLSQVAATQVKTAGSFGALGSWPTRKVIRLLDSAGNAVTGWLDVLNVSGAGNDELRFWPPLDVVLHENVVASWTYEIRDIYGTEVHSFTLRELPLTAGDDLSLYLP